MSDDLSKLQAENKALREALHAIHVQSDCSSSHEAYTLGLTALKALKAVGQKE